MKELTYTLKNQGLCETPSVTVVCDNVIYIDHGKLFLSLLVHPWMGVLLIDEAILPRASVCSQ